jgi:hypothetical protein
LEVNKQKKMFFKKKIQVALKMRRQWRPEWQWLGGSGTNRQITSVRFQRYQFQSTPTNTHRLTISQNPRKHTITKKYKKHPKIHQNGRPAAGSGSGAVAVAPFESPGPREHAGTRYSHPPQHPEERDLPKEAQLLQKLEIRKQQDRKVKPVEVVAPVGAGLGIDLDKKLKRIHPIFKLFLVWGFLYRFKHR